MGPDLLSALLRGLSFVALAQAAGGALFLVTFGAALGPSRRRIERLVRLAALAALVILPAQFALEAARMAGSFAGVTDAGLQRFALSTSLAHVLAMRMSGLVMLLLIPTRSHTPGRISGLLAALLLAGSFSLAGHTSTDSQRWLLGPLVTLHVLIVSFWFGALLPLMLVAQQERAEAAALVVARFSRIAGWLVPGILVAGLILAAWLLKGFQALQTMYGALLAIKLAVFISLLGLAALNRWFMGPALASGNPRARRRFRQTVRLEWMLIAAVLVGTAFLTTLWSPT